MYTDLMKQMELLLRNQQVGSHPSHVIQRIEQILDDVHLGMIFDPIQHFWEHFRDHRVCAYATRFNNQGDAMRYFIGNTEGYYGGEVPYDRLLVPHQAVARFPLLHRIEFVLKSEDYFTMEILVDDAGKLTRDAKIQGSGRCPSLRQIPHTMNDDFEPIFKEMATLYKKNDPAI